MFLLFRNPRTNNFGVNLLNENYQKLFDLKIEKPLNKLKSFFLTFSIKKSNRISLIWAYKSLKIICVSKKNNLILTMFVCLICVFETNLYAQISTNKQVIKAVSMNIK